MSFLILEDFEKFFCRVFQVNFTFPQNQLSGTRAAKEKAEDGV
jgi:hypothetical protein